MMIPGGGNAVQLNLCANLDGWFRICVFFIGICSMEIFVILEIISNCMSLIAWIYNVLLELYK